MRTRLHSRRVIVWTLWVSMAGSPCLTEEARERAEITIPAGTRIYCELGQRVESKKKAFIEGERVAAHVWRDVIVAGEVVIPQGTPVDTRISRLKPAKFAGIKGKIELEARSLTMDDGSIILLEGGYGKGGKGRKAASIGGAVLAWPLIFIRGKKAVLENGAIFDARTDREFTIVVDSSLEAALPEMGDSSLSAEILYEALQGKIDDLPMRITMRDAPISTDLVIDHVNGEPIAEPISLSAVAFQKVGDHYVSEAMAPLKLLMAHFRRGINRFEVASGEGDRRTSCEVVFDVPI